jgi:hypothetical protein
VTRDRRLTRNSALVAGLMLAVGGLAACSRDDPLARADVEQLRTRVNDLEARLRMVELARSDKAEQPVTLTLTWLTPGQPPSSTQSRYASPAACEAGRKKAVADAAAVLAARREGGGADGGQPSLKVVLDPEQPVLQATCSD